MVGEHDTAIGGDHAGSVQEVLVGRHEAPKGSIGAERPVVVESEGPVCGPIPVGRDQRVDHWLCRLCPLAAGLQQFACRQGAVGQECRLLDGRKVCWLHNGRTL